MNKENKLYKTCAWVLVCSMLLSGCGFVDIPDLNEEQSRLISEYAVNVLLKHSASGHSRVMSAEEIKKAYEETAESEKAHANELAGKNSTNMNSKTENAGTETAKSERVITDTTINKFYNIEGIDITYDGYSVCTSYPDDSSTTESSQTTETVSSGTKSISKGNSSGAADNMYFSLDADPGKKLVIVNFKAANNTDNDIDLNMASYSTQFSISINGGKEQRTLTTLVPNDISNFSGTVPAGGSVDLTAMVQIDEAKADAIESTDFTMVNGDKTATIELKK